MTMRTGIFGGTFNPLHTGHLLIAESVLSDYPLDRMLFMPAAIPPHKQKDTICSANLRLTMLQQALKPYPEFDVLDYELVKGGVSYTIDTVRWLKECSPYRHDDLFFLIGGDSLTELHTWRSPERLLNEIQVLAAVRPGFDIQHLNAGFRQQVQILQTPLMDIASARIRQRVRDGLSIRFLVPESVERMIYQKGLYL